MQIKRLVKAVVLSTLPVATNAQSLAADLQRVSGVAAYQKILDAVPADDLSSVLEQKDSNGDTPLIAAAKSLNIELFDLLVTYGADPSARDANRRNLLNIAVRQSSPLIARRALDAGTDPRSFTLRFQGSALIFASARGEVEIVKMLIEAGAPLDRVNTLGWSALLEATLLGDGGRAHQEIVRLLLDAGADPTIADHDGITPHEHAIHRGHHELANIFLLFD